MQQLKYIITVNKWENKIKQESHAVTRRSPDAAVISNFHGGPWWTPKTSA